MKDVSIVHDKRRKPITSSSRIAGPYPYYGANGVQDYVDGFIFDGNFVLVGEDGTVVTDDNKPIVNWVSGKIWVNNHAHIIGEKSGYSLRFLYYYLQTIDIGDLVHGNIPKLTQQDLKELKIPDIHVSEQMKIVNILDKFEQYCTDLSVGLPAEIKCRQKQYEFYRDKILSFEECS